MVYFKNSADLPNGKLNTGFARDYCKYLGLQYWGDDYMKPAIEDASALDFTQEQFDSAVKHSLWHVRSLFSPQNYSYWSRVKIAMWFLFGKMKPLTAADS